MKWGYLFIISISFFLFLSCERIEEEDSAEKQKERIESYLTTKGVVYTIIDGVYRQSVNVAPIPYNVALSEGDSLYVEFAQYMFYKEPTVIFNTNIPSLAGESLDKDGLSFELLGMKYGEGKVIEGLNVGLRGSMMGDSLILHMASDKAYGNKANGVVPKYSSISMFVYIKKIVKNL